MKIIIMLAFVSLSLIPFYSVAQASMGVAPVADSKKGNLYIDVHQLEPGKVKYEDVANAHAKDLAVEKKYGVKIKGWCIAFHTPAIPSLSEKHMPKLMDYCQRIFIRLPVGKKRL
jgi:hypothetical protein